MLFHEKIRILLNELGVSRAELARASGLDVSLISRFHSGDRVPSRFSPQLDKLSVGVATLALQQKNHPRICALCGVPECAEISTVSDAVNAWINTAESGLRPQRARKQQAASPARQNTGGAFAEKLDALIRAAEVTNTALARYLNVDASLISRFRAGVRRPDGNERLVAGICTFFSLKEYAPRQREALFRVLGVAPRQDSEALLDALRAHLQPGSSHADRAYADGLLEALDSMRIKPEAPAAVPPAERPVTVHAGEMELYRGNAGLRRAVSRLFERVLADGNVKELRLFCDIELQWALEDKAFLDAWPEQLRRIMDQGARFTFVVSLDADLSGILHAMGRWIPLFMTGRMNICLLLQPEARRFSCTLLLADKIAAIQSIYATKTAASALYLYTGNRELVENGQAQFDALCLTGCVPVRLFGEGMQAQYQRFLPAFERAPGDTDAVLHSLSAYTIPPPLMERMLRRADVPRETRERILTYHQLAAKRAIRNLSLYSISDYICLADPADLEAGRVRVELPWLDGGVRVAYTPEEYAEHIKNLIELLRTYPGYSIYLLPQMPFQNLMLIVRQGTGTLIRKLNRPCLAVATAHPALLNAISNYIDLLRLRSVRVHPDRGRGLMLLLQYLQLGAQAGAQSATI
ncbi:MAG TPA: helix-turn-helix transcriptional regulator [Feifaniaceae bacterium]|nr:helix-turn-helix transcriptional regulator [Feifaniaceae bacterium]